ncbi:hypothetical protein TB2_016617 [Malus domestica]
MAPPAAIRRLAVVSSLLLFQLITPSTAIYCDEDDCYDLLGVTQSANSSEIKKAYYKLSLQHHPDKNPVPESKKLFVKIANAYEILKDEALREQYDYAIAHPDEWTRYNQAVDMVKKTPAYKNRLRALELERIRRVVPLEMIVLGLCSMIFISIQSITILKPMIKSKIIPN